MLGVKIGIFLNNGIQKSIVYKKNCANKYEWYHSYFILDEDDPSGANKCEVVTC